MNELLSLMQSVAVNTSTETESQGSQRDTVIKLYPVNVDVEGVDVYACAKNYVKDVRNKYKQVVLSEGEAQLAVAKDSPAKAGIILKVGNETIVLAPYNDPKMKNSPSHRSVEHKLEAYHNPAYKKQSENWSIRSYTDQDHKPKFEIKF